MQLFKIPHLYCPFPSHTNFELEKQLSAHTQKWLIDFNLLGESFLLHYQKQNFASMIVRSYPYGSFKELCAWCDLNTLLFIIDDQLDEEFIIADQQALINYGESFILLLEKGIVDDSGKGHLKALLALEDFWYRIRQVSSLRWQEIFIQNIRDMFSAGLWQFQHIVNGEKPTLKAYYQLRQYLGAAHLASDSLEVTGNINMPDEVYKDETIKNLTICARNAICFANDLFSLAKEIAKSEGGAEFNIVSILQNERGISIDEAITTSAHLHDQEVLNFMEYSNSVRTYGNATDNAIKKYISGLEYLMRGNIDWSTEATTRYPHIYGK
ncbi:terpene synthase family protein [Chitinophaga sp. 22321]|uniref:terpene synthase family protein n=1 Tax=Chitinophaga sp. 22321 TaxID=3453909 RepID=UPI003F85F2B1